MMYKQREMTLENALEEERSKGRRLDDLFQKAKDKLAKPDEE